MLIIFDLDDTLIDTSGSVAPGILKNALHAMQKEGLALKNFKMAYRELLQLNAFHISSREAISEFLEINQAPPSCFQIGVREVYENPRLDWEIKPLEGAGETLEKLSRKYQLVLVTHGKESVQREKMRRAGILPRFFARLYFCEGGNKKKAYEQAGQELGVFPLKHCALVCGDRISFDLAPAKGLGYNTVHIKWGRGLGDTGLKKDVDYTILRLKELCPLLENMQTKPITI